MRYPLAQHVRHWVLVSSSDIAPSRRYSEICFRQSTSGSGGPTIATISASSFWFGSICSVEVLGFTLEVGVWPSLPSGSLVLVVVVFTREDLGSGYMDFFLETDGWLDQILREHAWRGRFTARTEVGKGIGYLIVSSENMVELETIELFLQLPNLLPVCIHAGVVTV
jgi:hypothetical protein